MNNTILFIIAVCCAIALCVFGIFLYGTAHTPAVENDKNGEATLQESDRIIELPYGNADVHLGQRAAFKDLTVLPLSLLEDSRCPQNAQCAHEGTVKMTVEIVSGLGTSTSVMKLGDTITTEAEQVTFYAVEPMPTVGETVPADSYIFTFEVEKREAIAINPPVTLPDTQPPFKTCYVGGCSSQLCTNSPDAASDCMYREEYACYAHASCEVQQNGECGWTETQELALCIQEQSGTVLFRE